MFARAVQLLIEARDVGILVREPRRIGAESDAEMHNLIVTGTFRKVVFRDCALTGKRYASSFRWSSAHVEVFSLSNLIG